ncbi:MAG TPA: PhnD/SsuA/transferrin family substrate-binding protein [candidate division Zixibacteria bacterium]|nr:PhnD/SsuA/transferrin family substrate-binding protein [candidate division Zixibacteria bacterium]
MLKITSIQAPNADFYCTRIAEYISSKLSIDTQFVSGIPWKEREEMIDSGDMDIAWLCGLPYIWKADRPNPNVELLAAVVMKGERYRRRPVYFSDVVVRIDSPFRSFEDLRGSRWAFNEPNSHSGYNVVRYHLATLGLTQGYFGEVVESGAHLDSLEMILNGQIDTSAIDSTVLEMELSTGSDLKERIRIVEVIGPSPIPPWVISRQLPESTRNSLRQVFLRMHADKAGRAILDAGQIAQFVSVTNQDYDPIREMERIGQTVESFLLPPEEPTSKQPKAQRPGFERPTSTPPTDT